MTFVVVSYSLVILGCVAAAGALSPILRRRRLPEIEASGDVLEERRRALLMTLNDLDEAHLTGALDGGEHLRLRLETEARLARVLHILDERADDSPEPVEVRRPGQGRVPRWAALALITVAVATGLAATLRSSLGARSNALAFTGDAPIAPSNEDPLSYFKSRVAENPRNVGARLDLAHRYLDTKMSQQAIDEYLGVLQLDRDNPEAQAHLGFVLWLGGRPQQGLRFVNRALETDPRYPEAMFFKGVILAQGLGREEDAADALRDYLDAAPFGAERPQARRLLYEIKSRRP